MIILAIGYGETAKSSDAWEMAASRSCVSHTSQVKDIRNPKKGYCGFLDTANTQSTWGVKA